MPKEEKKDKVEIFEDAKKELKEQMHKEYVTFVGFLGLLIRTVNPLSYKKITNTGVIQGLRFYFHLLCFSFFLFIIITIPYMFTFYDELRAEANNLNNFTLAPQMEVNQMIEFDNFGVVIANQKAYDGETILITQQSLTWKNSLCLISSIACLFDNEPHQVDFSHAHELVDDRDKFTQVIFFFILLMLPGIFILLFFFLAIKFMLAIFLFFVIGFIYTMAIRYEIHGRQLFLIATYSLAPTIIVQTAFGLYYETYYIPYLLSFVLFVICVYLVAEKPFHHFKHAQH